MDSKLQQKPFDSNSSRHQEEHFKKGGKQGRRKSSADVVKSRAMLGKKLLKEVKALDVESNKGKKVDAADKESRQEEEKARFEDWNRLKALTGDMLRLRISLQTSVIDKANQNIRLSSDALSTSRAAISKALDAVEEVRDALFGPTQVPDDLLYSDDDWDDADDYSLQVCLQSQLPDVNPSAWNINTTPSKSTKNLRLPGLALRQYRKRKWSTSLGQDIELDPSWEVYKKRHIIPQLDAVKAELDSKSTEFSVFHQPISKQISDFMRNRDFCRALYESINTSTSTPLYNDTALYTFLLKKHMTSSRGEEGADEMTQPNITRRTPSTKPRKLTKGRRLTFDPIPQLVGFMEPMDFSVQMAAT